MSDAPIQIVDERDQPIGGAPKEEAHRKGLYHRVARIMIEDPEGRVLLQHRAKFKGLYPDRWDNSTAGHVDEGESYETAAYREMAEEVGLTGVQLTEIGRYTSHGRFEWRIFNRFTRVYKVVVSPDTQFVLSPEEVQGVRWFTVAEAKQLVAEQPDKATDGLIEVIQKYY